MAKDAQITDVAPVRQRVQMVIWTHKLQRVTLDLVQRTKSILWRSSPDGAAVFKHRPQERFVAFEKRCRRQDGSSTTQAAVDPRTTFGSCQSMGRPGKFGGVDSYFYIQFLL